MPDGYVTITAGPRDVTIPAGTRMRDYNRPVLKTQREVTIRANKFMEVPLAFDGPSSPEIKAPFRVGQIREYSIDDDIGPIGADLTGVTFQIIPRWQPLTKQQAREGLVRLLQRRKETQPRTRYEKLVEDDLF